MKNILAIETSTKHFSLAVTHGETVAVHRAMVLDKVLSSSIIPSIQKILAAARVSLSRIDGFAVGLGPGSFTSLRVGLATVKALAFALKKPVVGISSLDVLAMNVPERYTLPICTLCDARRNLLYCCLFERKQGRLVKKSNYFLSGIDGLLKKIKGPVVFIGDGIPLVKEALVAHDKKICPSGKNSARSIFLDAQYWYPQARCLALLSLERFKKKKYDNIRTVRPVYLYPEDCQVTTPRKK